MSQRADMPEVQSHREETSFAELVEPHRAELRAHCRRLLGSPHDAEDALQEAMLRAWRSMPELERRSSLRSWLYRIATNTSLDAIRRRRGAVVPLEDVPAADGEHDPHDRYERREALERALVRANHVLTPRQRAVLFHRQVLGFTAAETAERLAMTVPAVNSALQRARATIDARH